jgi:hypothetical protein
MSHPANIRELSNHQIQDHELVLLVHCPGPKTFTTESLVEAMTGLRLTSYSTRMRTDRIDSLEFDVGLVEAE